jgi:hypothetical protein
MARGATNQANKTFGEAQSAFNTGTNRANALYGQLMPILQGEATNPQGYSPKDLGAMNTASQQSVGGSTAGAVGEGNLAAARTRNAGAFAPALDEAAREGGRTLSQNALEIQGKNADLKQKQQQAGISGLGSLYGQNSDELLKALGLGNEATNTAINSGKSGWFQNMLGLITALKPGGSVGGGQQAGFSFGG